MNEIEESKGNHRQAVDQLASPVLTKGAGTEAVSNRASRRRQERQGRKEMRGFGSVFRTSWYDKKTGEKKYSPRYTVKHYHNRLLIRELILFHEGERRMEATKKASWRTRTWETSQPNRSKDNFRRHGSHAGERL